MPLIKAGECSTGLAAALRARPHPAAAAIGPQPAIVAGLPADLDELLMARHSVRDFSAEPVTADQLRLIIKRAFAAQARDWPAARHGDVGLSFLVGAFRVTGLTPGAYLARYPGESPLAELAAPPGLDDLRVLYAAAPMLLHVCADIGQACEQGGAPGYGALLVRVGALGHAAWLAALSLGLAGSVYGRASGWVTRSARPADGGSRHLFTLAVGHPDRRDQAGAA